MTWRLTRKQEYTPAGYGQTLSTRQIMEERAAFRREWEAKRKEQESRRESR